MADRVSVCADCDNPIDPTDDFCPHCGTLRRADATCIWHPEREAAGACIVCCYPVCPDCGERIGGKFLCGRHAGLEIYEGMVRAYGGCDQAQVEYAKACLEQAGLHPFLYVPKASPYVLGAPEYSLYRPGGDYDGHIQNEIKVMVPCQELEAAERVLVQLRLIE